MIDTGGWDWSPGIKQVADVGQWRQAFNWVEELHASPDGEQVAAVVNLAEGEYSLCANGKVWDNVFDRIWYPRFSPDGRLAALVSDTGEWTVAVDDQSWNHKFGYVWGLEFSPDGKHIAAAVQQDMAYGMVLDDVPWQKTYPNLTDPAISQDGSKTCAVVQIVEFAEGEIHKFQKGAYSAAVDGDSWDSVFVNAWKAALSPDGNHLAAEVRTNLYDYTIAVDGKPWDQTYSCVWEPVFHPTRFAVAAPVRIGGQWTLCEDGREIWHQRFVQLWHQQYSADGSRLAAIVAPKYGRWTVAVDGRPWPITFKDMVVDLVFSADSRHVAALGKNEGRWTVCTDGKKWRNHFDMAFKPVFSPDGEHLAVKTETNGKYGIAVDDILWREQFDYVWDPTFSPQGNYLLIRAVRDGQYERQVIAVKDIVG